MAIIELKDSSWKNIIDVLHNQSAIDSKGNFWAAIQSIEEQLVSKEIKSNLSEYFPQTIYYQRFKDKYNTEGAIAEQLKHIDQEVAEVVEAVDEKDYEHAMEELVDLMHVAYSAMRLLPGYSIEKAEEMAQKVFKKNEIRGYYK